MTVHYADPAVDLAVEFRRAPRAVEVVFRYPNELGRRLVVLDVEPNETTSVRNDWITYEPAELGHPGPFRIWSTKPEPADGRKVVGLVAVAPFDGTVWKISRVTAGALEAPRGPMIGADELELVACLAERLDDGTALLSDLAELGLVVRVEVSRLSTPLGWLVFSGGRFRWTEVEP